jgi:spermidine/putrescine transport system substrate-binding protein
MPKHGKPTPRISRRDFLKLSAVTGAGLALASCSPQQTAELGGQASLRGATIKYIGWEGYDYNGSLQPLLTTNNMTINSTYGGNNEEIFSKLKAGSAGQYDVISIYHGNVPALLASDLVQPLDLDRLEHWGDIRQTFKNQPWQVHDGRIYSVPFTYGDSPSTYNPKYLPNGVQSWSDLLAPELRGRVVAVDNTTSDPYAALLAVGHDIRQLITKDQLADAMDWVRNLYTTNVRVITPSYGEMADVMAREEAWATSVSWTAIIGWVAEKGVELKYSVPSEGVAGWADNYLIPKGANLDVAYAFINQMTSPEGQKEMAIYLGQEMTNEKVVDLLPADLKARYDNVEANLAKTPFPPDPPLETDDPNIATFADWTAAYEAVKAAI